MGISTASVILKSALYDRCSIMEQIAGGLKRRRLFRRSLISTTGRRGWNSITPISALSQCSVKHPAGQAVLNPAINVFGENIPGLTGVTVKSGFQQCPVFGRSGFATESE